MQIYFITAFIFKQYDMQQRTEPTVVMLYALLQFNLPDLFYYYDLF